MTITVLKFGGTSVANYSSMLNCCRIMAQQPQRRVMVVSAPAGITNYLIQLSSPQLASDARQTVLGSIHDKITNILDECKANHIHEELEISQLSHGINLLLTELTQRSLGCENRSSKAYVDSILSFGERFSSLFCSFIFNQHYADDVGFQAIDFDIRQILITDNQHGQANPNIPVIAELSQQHLAPLLKHQCVITQGFIGNSTDGFTTTLGRGGSDYSAALLSEALNADICEIWTDVAGVYSTDPRLVKDAIALPELSYDEAAEMANFGAKVLHPATLAPTLRNNIPVFVGSSKAPEQGGTLIVKDCQTEPPFRGLTRRCGQELVTIRTPQMKGASGFMSKVFGILDEHDISVDLITTSEVAVALTFDQPLTSANGGNTGESAINQLRQFAEVHIDKDLDLITVVGNHLESTPGVSAKIFSALEQHNIRMVCYGANPHNLSFLVDDSDSAEIIQKLHRVLIENT